MLNFFKDAGVSLSLDGDRLKVEGLKQLSPDQAQEIRQKIQDNRKKIISELQIPAPEPPGMGPEYERIWNQAWTLADFVDGPGPMEERKTKLPELNELVEKMRVIEDKLQSVPPTPWLKKIPGLPDDLIQSPGVWIRTDKPIWIPETCPARCKWSGRCYGIAYFDHKPGKPLDCLGEQCPWME